MSYELHVYQAVRLVQDGQTVFELGSVRTPVAKTIGALIHRQRHTLAPGDAVTLFNHDDTERLAAAIVVSTGFGYLEYVNREGDGSNTTRSSVPLCADLWQPVWGDDILTDSAAAHEANSFNGNAGFIDEIRAFNPADAEAYIDIDVYVLGDA